MEPTRLTESPSLSHPIIQAWMASAARGVLASAVNYTEGRGKGNLICTMPSRGRLSASSHDVGLGAEIDVINESHDFLQLVFDTITENIAVIDNEGTIVFVNKSWVSFGKNNRCIIAKKTWNGINYLKECDKAAAMGDVFAIEAATGIRSVIKTDQDNFYFEYPCHSLGEKRWFMMSVRPFTIKEKNYFVISHQNITDRKVNEEVLLNQSRIDDLTDIANRRYYDEFLAKEWKRDSRLGLPISLAIIDLDHFKLLNDTYGHQAGDECLKSVGSVLKRFSKRPSDLCARYGGDEFSIVYGNTNLEQANILVNGLLNAIHSLKIPNEKSPTFPTLTASIGVATMYPSNENNERDLIKKSDELLYLAKKNGRNQIS